MKSENRKIEPRFEKCHIDNIYDECQSENNTRSDRMSSDIWISEWCSFFREEKKWSEKEIADHCIDSGLLVHDEKLMIDLVYQKRRKNPNFTEFLLFLVLMYFFL